MCGRPEVAYPQLVRISSFPIPVVLTLCFLASAGIGTTALVVDPQHMSLLAIAQTIGGAVGLVVMTVWSILRFRAFRRADGP